MGELIEFFFDFMSPYSYLAHQQVPALAVRFARPLVYRVIDLGEVKRLTGNVGPSTRQMPLKLRYARTDMKRWADRIGVPIVAPESNDSTRLNCGVFYAAERDQLMPYVDCVWDRTWGRGAPMDATTLREVATAMGWDVEDFVTFTGSDAAIRRYREQTQDAHERGVFGVPTLMTGGEMWWGNDRLDFVEDYLEAAARPEAARRGIQPSAMCK